MLFTISQKLPPPSMLLEKVVTVMRSPSVHLPPPLWMKYVANRTNFPAGRKILPLPLYACVATIYRPSQLVEKQLGKGS